MSSNKKKQNATVFQCMTQEGIMEVLQPYVTHVLINIWGRDFLIHAHAEIHILTFNDQLR